MSYNSRNYEVQGGSTWVVTGNLDVGSSGVVGVSSGRIDVSGTSGLNIKSGGQAVLESGGKFTVETGGINQQRPGQSLTSASSTGTALEPGNIVRINSSGLVSKTFTVGAPLAGEELTLYQGVVTTGANKFSLGVEVGSSEGVNANNKFVTGSTGSGAVAHLVALSSALWILTRTRGFTVTTG